MSQDTRKDKRAKVVSLNVRYKSATVDEFIENHSHDVSKGGIFVKTPTPFPPGTLLKFEIRLAGDKSVISGVGRVVWKREPTQAATEKPAGMGVKFIKIDDASRAVIDKLTSSKPEAGSAYTSDPAALEEEKNPTAAPGPNTMREITAAEPVSTALAPETLKGTAPAPTTAAAKAAVAASASTAPGPTGTTRAAAIGQKTLPLGSVPPEGLPKSTKTPSTTTTPAQTGASAAPIGGSTLPSTQSPLAGASGPPAPVKMKPQTMMGVAPAANKPVDPVAAPAAAAPASTKEVAKADVPAASPSSKPGLGGAGGPAPRPMTANHRKATMMGVAPAANPAKAPEASASSSSLDTDDTQQFIATAKPPVVETPKAPATMADAFLGGGDEKKKDPEKKPAASPMFPTSIGAEEPVKEPTMMKQAAELLEEALREAGGSMEDIGNNPLFAVANKAAASSRAAGAADKSSEVASSAPGADQSGDTVVMHKSSVTPSTPPVGMEKTERQAATPSPRSAPPPSSAAPSSAQTGQAARSVPPPAKPVGASIREPEKKGSMGMIIGLVAVVVVAAIVVFAVKSMGGGGGGDKPVPSATPANTASAMMSASATTSATPMPPVSASAVPAVVSAMPTPEEPKDAGKAAPADAGKAATTAATPAPKPKPKPKPKPAPSPEPGTEPSPSPEPSPAPAPMPEPSPSPAPEL